MKDKKTTVMGIVIAVLIVVVLVLGGLLFTKRESKNDNTSESDATENVIPASDNSTEVTDTEKNTEQNTDVKSDTKDDGYIVEIGHDGTWDSDGKKCATENIDIYNKTNKKASSWKLDITYASEPSIDQIWNAEYKIKESTITLTSMDYNKTINAGESVNLGYNISASKLEIKNYTLYIDGKEYQEKKNNADKEDTNTDSEKKDVKNEQKTDNGTPFENHGKLSVRGTDIVDMNGDKYQLKGVSTHGITWFPDYVNSQTFQSLRDSWGVNLVRLSMYTDTGDNYGYCSGGDKDKIMELVDDGVQYATELGIYVIVDWHILSDNDPNMHIEDAKVFFDKVSSKYKDNGNVIFEICNEPNGGTDWSKVKSYAETIIPIIRKNDADSIIIVGTPNWSQDVDVVSEDPITNYENIMYAAHFYAATHKDDLRQKVQKAIDNGLPVFISEFSLCDASGSGSIDYDSSDEWFELIESNNLSYSSWSLSNKNETSALLNPETSAISDFTEDDLSDTGKYIRDKIMCK